MKPDIALSLYLITHVLKFIISGTVNSDRTMEMPIENRLQNIVAICISPYVYDIVILHHPND